MAGFVMVLEKAYHDEQISVHGSELLGQALALKIPNAVILNVAGCSKIKHRQVTDLDVTDLGFSGPRIPFCATGALWGRVTPFS